MSIELCQEPCDEPGDGEATDEEATQCTDEDEDRQRAELSIDPPSDEDAGQRGDQKRRSDLGEEGDVGAGPAEVPHGS
ncbi:MAG TPA: hypothetical protein VFW86_02015, partial [Candidatus Limnocylindrales bacterium]|nr:hypothetical protein [Candidatus Limnocylindrales bacterium]